nr:hypothetical protein [Salinicoccus sp. RF5]
MDIQKAASRGSFFVLLKLYIPKILIILIGEFKGVDLQEQSGCERYGEDSQKYNPGCIKEAGQEK